MKKAILLVNLGTPANTTYFGVRKYLSQFLADRRVVDRNPLFWQPLLHLLLLQIIPFKSANNYKKIFKNNESPLLTYTESQVDKIQAKLNDDFVVDFAFTYDAGVSENSIDSKIKSIMAKGIDDIIILPMYPQYCEATTASIYDQVGQTIQKLLVMPSIKIIRSYHNNDIYIKSLADSVQASITSKTDVLVCSFHGVPVKLIEKGDLYKSHCEETFSLLNQELKSRNINLNSLLSYQSKFGSDEWLSPSSQKTIEALAEENKNIAVIAPGFAVDCIETIEEINMGLKEDFYALNTNDDSEFIYIPCLNATDDAIKLYSNIIINSK